MNETIIITTIIYLTLFRLAIIILGGISITLGYRLFIKGIFSTPDTTNTEMTAKMGNMNITLKNAAPGTFFVVFGSVLVITMLMSSPPSAEFKTLKNQETGEESQTATMRGGNENDKVLKEKIQQIENKMEMTARALNKLAWLYYQNEQLVDAEFLSSIAVELAPNSANISDTFAEILFKRGNCTDAIEQMQKTVKLQADTLKSDYTEENQQMLAQYEERLETYQTQCDK